MAQQAGNMRVVYDDFSGGDYGEIGGAKAPKGSFHAMNMFVTADGFLCPRPGWKNQTPSNMPTGKVLALAPTEVGTRSPMFVIGNTVYTHDPAGTNLATSIGTFDVTPTLAMHPKRGTTEFYVAIPGDKSYMIDPVAPAVSDLVGSPAGIEIEVYGERLIVALGTNRIQFSAAADFNTWPAENFIDVGDGWAVTAMREQNNHLTLFKSRGKHIMTGVPGVNPTLRRAERSLGVIHAGQMLTDQQDMIWYIPSFRENPASFDGASSRQIDYLRELNTVRDGDQTPPLVRGVAESMGDRSPSTVVITQGGGANIMLLFHNGIWTRHRTSVNISGMVRGGNTGDFYLTDGGATGVAGKIYVNAFLFNRMGFTTDGLFQPGDDSTTPLDAYVTFPQFWAPDGTEIKVEEVIVDFEKFNTGSATNNHFDIQIDMIGRIPVGKGDASPVTYSWDEAGSGAGASIGNSKRDRKVQGVKSAYASGYELSLKNVKGVKIKPITVVLSFQKSRPVAH